jgi:hypothetical protein
MRPIRVIKKTLRRPKLLRVETREINSNNTIDCYMEWVEYRVIRHDGKVIREWVERE